MRLCSLGLEELSPLTSPLIRYWGRSSHHHGWAPFNHHNGKEFLGYEDLAFLSLYALGMYVMGYAGDRMDLRLFLTGGMVFSGVFAAMIGFAKSREIHSLLYFLVMQVMSKRCIYDDVCMCVSEIDVESAFEVE